MTEQEKRYIVERRAQGATFVQIGKEIDRSENTVRSVFVRAMNKKKSNNSNIPEPGSPYENRPSAPHPAPSTYCKYCGRPFSRTPHGGKRKFCSNKCRDAWFNEQKRRVAYKRICESCGKTFIAYGNPNRRFCSRKCFASSRHMDEREAGHG